MTLHGAHERVAAAGARSRTTARRWGIIWSTSCHVFFRRLLEQGHDHHRRVVVVHLEAALGDADEQRDDPRALLQRLVAEYFAHEHPHGPLVHLLQELEAGRVRGAVLQILVEELPGADAAERRVGDERDVLRDLLGRERQDADEVPRVLRRRWSAHDQRRERIMLGLFLLLLLLLLFLVNFARRLLSLRRAGGGNALGIVDRHSTTRDDGRCAKRRWRG